MVSRVFSALCVYSTIGHHPHPLGYLCAKFRFFRGLHCWASPWRKIAYWLTQSLTQLIWCHMNRNLRRLRFGISRDHKFPCTAEFDHFFRAKLARAYRSSHKRMGRLSWLELPGYSLAVVLLTLSGLADGFSVGVAHALRFGTIVSSATSSAYSNISVLTMSC